MTTAATRICPKCHRDAPVEDFVRRGIGDVTQAVGICCLPDEHRYRHITVTEHAIDRYIERVQDVGRAEARLAILELAVTGTWSTCAPAWADSYPTKAGYVTCGEDIMLPLQGQKAQKTIKTVITYDPVECARSDARVSHKPYRQLERHAQGRYLHDDRAFVGEHGIVPVEVFENAHQHVVLTFREDTPGADEILECLRTWADVLDRPIVVHGPDSLTDRHLWLHELDAEKALPVRNRPVRDVPAGALGYVPEGWEGLRGELLGYLGWDMLIAAEGAVLPTRVDCRRNGRPQLALA